MVDDWCQFILIEDVWECPLCATRIQMSDDDYEEAPVWPCTGPKLDSSNLAKDITTFFNSHNIKDICDENTISYRHSICNSCELFQNNSCLECGCSITRDRNYLNKLAISSESCPKHKW